MNREDSSSLSSKQLFEHHSHEPLQSYSHGGTDRHEHTAILSPIQPVEPRVKRSRIGSGSSSNRQESEEQEDEIPWKQSANVAAATKSAEDDQLLIKKPKLKIQPLSLDRGAIAPSLAQPTAPFAKSERKKAYVSAIYYSECFLRGIKPVEADTAAVDIQNQYTKWWVQSKNNINNNQMTLTKKKRKRDSGSDASPQEMVDTRQPSEEQQSTLVQRTSSPMLTKEQIGELKQRLVEHLQKTGGDTTTTAFQDYCSQLQAAYQNKSQSESLCQDGTWLTLSKPTFSECQGRNQNGEYLYTLGRMSFDMFRPTHLKCSIRAVMNNIRVMNPKSKPRSFPSRLSKELHHRAGAPKNSIRHYDIVVAFTIEAGQTRQGTVPKSDDEFVVPRPIRGLMTNHGYMIADPNDNARSSIWFSGGSIEVQDEVNDMEVWKQIFDDSLIPRRDMRAMANMLAAKVLLGAYTTTSSGDNNSNNNEGQDCDSSDESAPLMNYFFKRPIGGHGEVYCDALYQDDTLRIMRGHRGSIFVFNRVPSFDENSQDDSTSSSGVDDDADRTA